MIAVITIIGLTTFSLLGALYARVTSRADALIGLYVLYTSVSQIVAAKIAQFDLGILTVTAPAAMLVFPITFLLTDIVNEKFGRREVHRMIFITLVTQIALSAVLYASIILPAAPFWASQDAWGRIFGVVPRIIVASWLTFLVSENLDAWLFHHVRRITGGRHLWVRNVFSSIPALTVDTVLFVTLAFYGTGIPLAPIMIGQFTMKYLIVVLNIPFMYVGRSLLGQRLETADTQSTGGRRAEARNI